MLRPALLAAVLIATPAAASADDAIELVDKTRIVGKLVHYYEGMVSVKLPSGSTMQIPREKIRAIVLELPAPRAALSTPQKAFQRLREAALRGNLETYLDAHSAYYQMFLTHQIAQAGPEKFRQQLMKEWSEVRLEVTGAEVKGDTAILKVRRRQGEQSEEGEFRFVRENQEWKMILPL